MVLLPVPNDAQLRLEFETFQVINDIQVPYGQRGTADYLEPLTKDYDVLGVGGGTQAITKSEFNLKRIVNTKTGEILKSFE